MSVPHLFSAGGIQINAVQDGTNMSAPVGFAALTGQAVEHQTEVRKQRAFGEVFPSQAAVTRRSQQISGSTTQLATALGFMGIVGGCFDSNAGAQFGLDAYLLKHDECNYRDKTDSRRFRASRGFIVPRSLTATHGDVASLSFDIVAISKSGGLAVVESDAVDISSLSLADSEQFGLVSQTVGNIALPGCKSLSIEFGVELATESADGSPYDEWVSVVSVTPRITLSGMNPRWLASGAIPSTGIACTHANTRLSLGRYASDGSTFLANTAASHLQFTAAGIAYITTAASASDETTPAETSLVIEALHDGTNVPLLLSVNTALAAGILPG